MGIVGLVVRTFIGECFGTGIFCSLSLDYYNCDILRSAAGFGFFNRIITAINDYMAFTINSNSQKLQQDVHKVWTGTIGKNDQDD